MDKIVQKLFLSVIFLFSANVLLAQGYKINISIAGLEEGTEIVLANHFGDKQYIKDSAIVNSKGMAVFEGKEKVQPGLYLVVMPDKNYFEIIMDEKQEFTVETTKENPVKEMKIKGSEENSIFYEDLKFITNQRIKFENLNARKTSNKDNPDSVAYLDKQMKGIDDAVKKHREKLISSHPGLFYSKLLKTLEEPTIPDNPDPADSTFAYRYYKAHFFDNLDFSDARLLYSPAYYQKISKYLKQLVYQDADSIIAASDYILKNARANPEVFKFTLAYLLNEHAASKIMGMDAVYVHLAENYYLKGDADWVGEEQLESIRKDAMALKPFLIGKKVPNLVMKDMNGEWRSLYDLKTPYTILYFWDADCGHCRTETPKLKTLYDKVKDKGVEVYAVSIELTRDHWDKFIEENHLNWINVIDTAGETNMRASYNIKGTPVLYLLDKDKKIVAKRLDVENLEKMLEHLVNEDKPFSDNVLLNE